MISGRSWTAFCRSRWLVPVLCAVLGVVVLVVWWLGGSLGSGLVSMGIMVGFGLFLLLAGRSETIRGLRGDGRDERFAQIDLRATAIAGSAVIVALIAAFLTEIARGHDGNPYGWLLAIGGLSYLLAVAFLRWRG
jgi:hypothetical protein